MKKKNLRKLSLSRETIRTLVDLTPARVAGGADPRTTADPTRCVWDTHYSCPTWPEVCDPTFADPNTTFGGEIS
jgi:hypothetical protein